jgi:hypothetical protein
MVVITCQNSLYVKRQDAFSQWGLFYSKFPADPIGEQIINNFTINSENMFVKYQINLSTVPSGTTATTINVPIIWISILWVNLKKLKKNFAVETEKAINPIIDYEKVRVTPTDLNGIITSKISIMLI